MVKNTIVYLFLLLVIVSACSENKDNSKQNSSTLEKQNQPILSVNEDMETDVTAAKTVSDCENLIGLSKSMCITNVAKETKDWHVCKEFTTPREEEDCMSMVAAVKKDKSVCYNIQNTERRNFCLNNA